VNIGWADLDRGPVEGGRWLSSINIVTTFVLVALASSFVGTRAGASPPKFENLTGKATGTLQFTDAKDAKISFGEARKVYLVDFMAIGCQPCMDELPELLRLHTELAKSRNFQLVLVVYGWRSRSLLEAARILEVGEFPLYADTEGAGGRLNARAWPTKFLVRDGRVLEHQVGGGKGAYDRWKLAVTRELN
jgi:thiol-disulfide isomerase/thioredoxin